MANQHSKTLRLEAMIDVEPMTSNQGLAFDAWDEGSNLILNGAAGTGKTFIAMAMALEEVLERSKYKKLVIVRSVVPTRDIGFLPGTEEEKIEVYAKPYIGIASQIFRDKRAWEKLLAAGQVEFECTSFVRGDTWDNCIVLVDEMQNCNFHELDSVITRLGENSRIIFCGDYYQSDLLKRSEKEGLQSFLNVIQSMSMFSHVKFDWKDIVRSKLVREYIITKEKARAEGHIPIDS